MDIPPASTPVVCDMTGAPDALGERLEEYRRLFAHALISKERTAEGIRFRLRAAPGVAAWAHDLAAREQACCAFFAFAVTTDGDQVLWDAAVSDDAAARAVLEQLYRLPETGARDRALRTAGQYDGHTRSCETGTKGPGVWRERP
ncbi:hypothetical protein ITP53_27770 [Nonomuraea sp. K274]|uniref:Uncharacterized protein n=1 Tax=Nonomuraea cypriaca TaxID=1187855 RepID=A0A931AD89_9ACTN|nr:hypothetical protein [Nonomuraea cypriaca]MBF8189465.1 hypothetical protein [Nonomuraea cypriaca]